MDKQSVIDQLKLEPHLEGGYFKRSYSSPRTGPIAEGGERLWMSSIYYMLTNDSPIGYFHRNRSDIVHYWHAGAALTYWLIDPLGNLSSVRLGPDIANGELLQLLVPGGYWKATHLQSGDYGLLSEAVTPGFDYEDMSLAVGADMQRDYPQLWGKISKYCKI